VLKVFAFDLGNTLVDDARLLSLSIEATAAWLGKLLPPEASGRFAEVYRRVNEATRHPFISHTYGEISFFEAAFRELGITEISPDQALRAYRGFLDGLVEVDPELAPALAYLRESGYRLAIISNERTFRVESFLETTGLRPFFDEVVVSEAVGAEKPDARIFRHAYGLFGIRGEELAFFGDNEIADGACREFGSPFVLVTRYKKAGWGWEEGSPHPPDHVMPRIDRKSLEAFLDDRRRVPFENRTSRLR